MPDLMFHRNILLISEDKSFCHGLKNSLPPEMYAVHPVSSVSAANRYLKEGSADLVLVDLDTTAADAIQSLMKVHADILDEYPVLFMSLSTDLTLPEELDLKEAGFHASLDKHSRPEFLTEFMEAVFAPVGSI